MHRRCVLECPFLKPHAIFCVGKRFYWEQVVKKGGGGREWIRRTQLDATKTFKVAVLRNTFVFAPGKHIGVYQYADVPGYMPRFGEGRIVAEEKRGEQADADWLHNQELLRQEAATREETDVEANDDSADVVSEETKSGAPLPEDGVEPVPSSESSVSESKTSGSTDAVAADTNTDGAAPGAAATPTKGDKESAAASQKDGSPSPDKDSE